MAYELIIYNTSRLSHPCLFSDHDNIQTSSATVCEVYIKEEPIDAPEEQQSVIKADKCVDIKHEPLLSEDANCSRNLVSFHGWSEVTNVVVC